MPLCHSFDPCDTITDKLENTTTKPSIKSTYMTTSTAKTTVYLAPHTAATQKTKETIVVNEESANAQMISNLSDPIWVAVYVVAGVAAVLIAAGLATMIYMCKRKTSGKRQDKSRVRPQPDPGIELTEVDNFDGVTEEENVEVSFADSGVSVTETVVSAEAGVSYEENVETPV